MKPVSEKYNRVLSLLRKSKPILDSTEDIEREVIKRIAEGKQSGLHLSQFFDFLFRWAYIGWVRRSLITASIILVLIFVYQQGIILKRINLLSRQIVVKDNENVLGTTNEIEKLLMIYKNSGKRLPSKNITIPERQMKKLLESMEELQIKNKDLEELIERDPELKKLIEKKLTDYSKTKINL